jgi:hypothetical protein
MPLVWALRRSAGDSSHRALCDLATANGRFSSIGEGAISASVILTLDAEGRMAVPG